MIDGDLIFFLIFLSFLIFMAVKASYNKGVIDGITKAMDKIEENIQKRKNENKTQ